MTATGYDDELRFRISSEEKRALDAVIEEETLSDLGRAAVSQFVDQNADEIDDDVLREARRKRADREGDKFVDRATFRKRVMNLGKSMHGSGLTAYEIEDAFQKMWDQADHLPDKLKPEAVKEYIDCLLALVRVYDELDTNATAGTDGVPNKYNFAVDVVNSEYPDAHKDKTREIIRRAPTDDELLSELDEATRNGLLDPLEWGEDDEDVPDDADIVMGGEPMTDGGVDVRDAYDAATDEGQSGLGDVEVREDEETTVRERLDDKLAGDIIGVETTARYGGAAYLLVTRDVEWSEIDDDGRDIPVLDVRTVVVDLEEDEGGVEDVRVTDNGVWFRRDEGVAQGAARMLARTASEVAGDVDAEEPLLVDGCDDEDVEMLLDATVDVERAEETEGQATHKMEAHPGIDPSRDWGYGAEPPQEAYDLAGRMRRAGLEPSDHFIRLWWGQKKPHSKERSGIHPDDELRPAAELKGNYGVEVRQRDEGLVLVDIDDPEAFDALDADLPETYSVSSPHGSDDRRHAFFVCDDKGRVAEELGGDGEAWSAYEDWGELYVGNPFVVGPGSQLSAYGCDNGEHERGDADACDECASEDGGYYEVVEDAPIVEVDADTLLSLVGDGDDESDDEEDEEEDEEEVEDGVEKCDNCGAAYPDEDADEYLKDAGPIRVCRGGCDG